MEYGHRTSDFFEIVLIKTNQKPHSLVTPRVIEGGGICSVNKGRFNLLRQLWCRWSVQVVREPFGQKIDPPIFITLVLKDEEPASETTDEIELSSGVGVSIVEPVG